MNNIEVTRLERIIGLVFTSYTLFGEGEEKDSLKLECEDGCFVHFQHDQDCCENVYIQDINGDIDNIIGSPIILAEEVINNEDSFGIAVFDDSFTWTFYKLATVKGYVVIRFLGESNGYYSESVDIVYNVQTPDDKIKEFTSRAFS